MHVFRTVSNFVGLLLFLSGVMAGLAQGAIHAKEEDEVRLGKQAVVSALAVALGCVIMFRAGKGRGKRSKPLWIAGMFAACLSSFLQVKLLFGAWEVVYRPQGKDFVRTVTVKEYRALVEQGYEVPPLAGGKRIEDLPPDGTVEFIVRGQDKVPEAYRAKVDARIVKHSRVTSAWPALGFMASGFACFGSGAIGLSLLEMLLRHKTRKVAGTK